MRFVPSHKSATLEAMLYPTLVLLIMWLVFLIDRSTSYDFYKWGVRPGFTEGWKGIFFMPFIHGQKDFAHIVNNSFPTFVLLSTLIYFYREIAIYVVLFIWLGGGFLLWYLAQNTGSYHIGMSGVIYGLFGFLLVSGFLRKYLPLQAISLFIAFLYGSLVWGILPMEQGISWEGHLFGFIVGSLTALAFRKKGPVAPKYAYEIEKEMGIEPPDFEGEILRNSIAPSTPYEHPSIEQNKTEEATNNNYAQNASQNNYTIVYHFQPKKDITTKLPKQGDNSEK
ncbi:MAG: rhomboid family intramembrane serine protease [Crocinitomicaceae bacterium]|nr:rhomboid family intramembrane serine protease [Crocinitomicaceae bacterium]